MPPSRRKAPKQLAPQTLEAAISLLAEYRDTADLIDDLEAEAARAIAAIKTEFDTQAASRKLRLGEMFLQLRAWWAVAAPELTDGKRKSIELAGALIGERTTPPALKLPKGTKAEEVVERLLSALAGEYLVTTNKLDKQAIIKALRVNAAVMDPVEDIVFLHELAVLRDKLGLTVEQREEFFIDRPAKEPAVEQVALPPDAGGA